MAKELVKTKKEEVIKAENVDVTKMSQSELGATLDSFEVDEENEVTSEYLQIEVGEELRVWFIEMFDTKKIGTKTNEVAPTARFIQRDGSRAISQTSMLVSTCAQFKKATPILIQCTGEAGPVGQRYKVLKIVELK